MLKENSKVKVYICSHRTYPNIGDAAKTRNADRIFEVKIKNGKLGIDYNTSRSPYHCRGEIFTPFETFSWNVVFVDVDTGKQYHYSNIVENIEEV